MNGGRNASCRSAMQTDGLIESARQYGMTRIVDGRELWHSSVFLLVASLASYNADHADGRHQGQALVTSLLSLAQQYGFVQVQALVEHFEQGDYGERTFMLARAAFVDVPPAELGATLAAAGIQFGR